MFDFTSCNQAQEPLKEIDKMLTSFVKDLNDLNLESFMDNFTNDATVFYPRNSFSMQRVEGKDSLTEEFASFFTNVRNQKDGPPYLNISPTDRKIQLFGNVAVVSLHFELGDEFHRRTLILEKHNNKWLINHIHASFLIESK